jgi:hypothetical protein
MSQGTGQNGGGPPRTAHQPEVQWDLKDAISYTSTVANSTTGADDVVLNLGVTERHADAPAEVAVRLQRRITLRPLTARNLRDMLRDVIADIDADRPRGRS